MTMYEGPPRRLPDGQLLVQLPGEGPDGQIVEGLVPIGPDHSLYAIWDQHLPKDTTP